MNTSVQFKSKTGVLSDEGIDQWIKSIDSTAGMLIPAASLPRLTQDIAGYFWSRSSLNRSSTVMDTQIQEWMNQYEEDEGILVSFEDILWLTECVHTLVYNGQICPINC